MKQSITLGYTLPEGCLQPHFEALRRGEALASKCGACGHVAFPARVLCADCGADALRWVTLPGTARISCRTGGAEKGFALVRFDGADAMCTVALKNPETASETGKLCVPENGEAGLWLLLDTETAKGDENV